MATRNHKTNCQKAAAFCIVLTLHHLCFAWFFKRQGTMRIARFFMLKCIERSNQSEQSQRCRSPAWYKKYAVCFPRARKLFRKESLETNKFAIDGLSCLLNGAHSSINSPYTQERFNNPIFTNIWMRALEIFITDDLADKTRINALK